MGRKSEDVGRREERVGREEDRVGKVGRREEGVQGRWWEGRRGGKKGEKDRNSKLICTTM